MSSLEPQPPPAPSTPRPLSTAYTSAYRGVVMAPHEVFDHFVHQPDALHMKIGHWKFNTDVDEKRAYIRGLHTPETILQAADRGAGALDNITLRWIPGTDDQNLTSPITGSAAQHLQEIYNARRFLGLRLSMRNELPLYPIHSRLKSYWDAKRAASTLQGVPNVPTPPLSSLSSSVPPSPSASAPGRASSHAKEPNSLAGDASSSEGATVILDKNPSGVRKGTPRSKGQTCVKCRKAKRRCIHDSLGEIDPDKANPPPPPPVSRNPVYPSTTFSAPTLENASLTTQPISRVPEALGDSDTVTFGEADQFQPHDVENGVSIEQSGEAIIAVPSHAVPLQEAPHTFPGTPTTHQMQAPRQHQSPRTTSDSLQPSRPSYDQRSLPYGTLPPISPTPSRTSYLGSTIPCSPINSIDSPLRPPPPHLTTTTQPQRQAVAPLFPGKPMRPAQKQSSLDGTAKTSAVIESSNSQEPGRNTSKGNARRVERLESTHIVASPEWTAPPMPSPELSGIDDRRTAIAGSTTPPIVKTSPAATKSPIAISLPTATRPTESSATKPPPKSTPTQLPTGKQHGAHSPKKASPALDKTLRDFLHKTASQPSSKQSATPATRSPLMVPDLYPGLPCMDCGEHTGHTSDCHIANLKPLRKLTTLDHRSLADAVVRFDPGPWTSHYGPPALPEPEDSTTQIGGIATIIRNEESYKTDTVLHGLPDAALIMMWAFKTSAGVEILEDFADDSGIGESEGEGWGA